MELFLSILSLVKGKRSDLLFSVKAFVAIRCCLHAFCSVLLLDAFEKLFCSESIVWYGAHDPSSSGFDTFFCSFRAFFVCSRLLHRAAIGALSCSLPQE